MGQLAINVLRIYFLFPIEISPIVGVRCLMAPVPHLGSDANTDSTWFEKPLLLTSR